MTDAVACELVDRLCEQIGALTQAVEALGSLVVAPASDLEPETACGHPDEERVSFSGFGTVEWHCKACGFHYGPLTHAAQGGHV